ncbi:MarR family transcriptional regulator [Comamonas testosteroni]|uniref:MarR family winged helix-turn-helix transcriptional regulator n=1 Tax=Comamonas testosteroni TaxID=285 RepID=UPI00265DB5A0|nr:MarR family transcriptional regulator [Comamonas testosteroni]WKL14402.1 MarR family transcriptional regulator [Comamonas testosteroni]
MIDSPAAAKKRAAAPATAHREPESVRDWREALHDERVAHLIKDAYRGTSSALQRRLREHGVSYGHWTFLRILWQTDGLTQRQLCEQAGVSEPAAVGALKSIEQAGWILRKKLPQNRKEIRVFLTRQGAALRSRIVACAEEVNQVATEGIPAEDLAVTRRTLLSLISNLGVDAQAFAERLRATAQEEPV